MHQRGPIQHTRLLVSCTSPQQIQDIALCLWALGDIVLELEGGARTLGTVVLICIRGDVASSDVIAKDSALEDAVCGFWLVRRDFMARLVDTRKGEVAMLADLTANVAAVYLYWSIPRRLESGTLTVVDRERRFLAAKPITSVISIAIHKSDLDAIVQEVS